MEIKLYATLREVVGRDTVKLRLKKGATVQEALEKLSLKYGDAMKKKLAYKQHWVVVLNERNVAFLDGWETVLKEGDHLAVLSPLSGG